MTRDQMLEASWIVPSVLIPIVLLTLLLWATFGEKNIHVPTHEGTIDPKLVAQTAPFDTPGVFQTGPGTYDVVMVGQTWTFRPNEIRVPRDARVRFTVTSQDVIHGLKIQGTNVNLMLIPGEVGRSSAHFREPGEYLFVCHEYCGTTPVPQFGHQGMYGRVIVE